MIRSTNAVKLSNAAFDTAVAELMRNIGAKILAAACKGDRSTCLVLNPQYVFSVICKIRDLGYTTNGGSDGVLYIIW